VPGGWRTLYDYAWFVGFAIAAAVYLLLEARRSSVGERTPR
jgi:cytosine/uracil/thiamine/allantoin permease